MAVTIYNEVSLDKLSEFKQKIVEGSGENLSNEDVEALKKELKNTQALCSDLGMQLTQTRVDLIKKNDLISDLGEQQATTKLELIKLKQELGK